MKANTRIMLYVAGAVAALVVVVLLARWAMKKGEEKAFNEELRDKLDAASQPPGSVKPE